LSRAFFASLLAVTVVAAGCGSAPGSEAATETSAATVAAAPSSAGAAVNPGIRDISGFALWSADDLARRNESLSTRIGEDYSARETLGEYDNHRFRFIRREADGYPEQHDDLVDVVIVQSGEGVLQLGGTLVDPEESRPGEWRGSALQGGERHPLRAGDIMHIPATVPHAFLVPDGQHFTYVLVKFPAP